MKFYPKEQIELFGDDFIAKQFRAQLGFLGQVDYSEPLEYLITNPPRDEEIRAFLIQESIRF